MLNTKERVTITNNLEFHRLKKGTTQAKLAQKVGVGERHYQRIEYGITKPNVYLARRLADALGIVTYEDFKDLFPLPGEQV